MSNINFETINDTLCRMVEPEQLTPDSQFPCLARLIQDDSPMGRMNKQTRGFSIRNGLSLEYLHGLPTEYMRYEIIGYPVETGSAEWALWQHINGNVLSNPKHGLFRWKYRSDSTAWDCIKIYQDGWIIDSEPQPTYAVGDWVSDGVVQGRITYIDNEVVDVRANDDNVYTINEDNLHKLQPSEIVVDFGNGIKGTISKIEGKNQIMVFQDNFPIAWINIDYIEDPLQTIVRDLLEKQEGE